MKLELGSGFMVFADLSCRGFKTFTEVFCHQCDLVLFTFSYFSLLLPAQVLEKVYRLAAHSGDLGKGGVSGTGSPKQLSAIISSYAASLRFKKILFIQEHF